MAEALLNHFYGEELQAESAGLEPGELNPMAIEAMRMVGIDISNAKTNSVFEKYKSGELFAHIITVCDATTAERCPIFPGVTNTIHWSFSDPSAFDGTREEMLARTVEVREQIFTAIQEWVPTVTKTPVEV
jgi:arsenate reductase